MLSAEAFSEIVNAFGSNSTPDPVHKNRRAIRVQHNGRTMIFRASDNLADAAIAVQMRDISARGCSFTCKTKLNRGSNFVIQFSRVGQSPTGMLCTVVHCRVAGSLFRIGAEFTCTLDAARAKAAPTTDVELDRIRNSILD